MDRAQKGYHRLSTVAYSGRHYLKDVKLSQSMTRMVNTSLNQGLD